MIRSHLALLLACAFASGCWEWAPVSELTFENHRAAVTRVYDPATNRELNRRYVTDDEGRTSGWRYRRWTQRGTVVTTATCVLATATVVGVIVGLLAATPCGPITGPCYAR